MRAIVDHFSSGTPVAFLGDDLTDESGFRSVNRSHNPHLSVLVRRALRDTSAEIWLKPPDELRWFLRQWIIALSGRTTERFRRAVNEADNHAEPSTPHIGSYIQDRSE